MTATAAACSAAPVVNFTADNTSVCIGDPVWFNDTSEYTPVGANDDYFEWDFGDGNTTAGYRVDGYNAPTYYYSFAGNKTVILTVTNKYGSDNETKTDYIEVVDCSITAYFTSNVTCQIGVPVDVLFESSCDQSENKNSWQPGDGMLIEDVQNLTYTYESTGAYTVTHVCTPPPPGDASSYTLSVVIGPEGTVCEGNCTACGNGYCNRDEYPNYLIVGATLGLLLSLIIIRRNEPE
jgi:PKD repeat protein